MPNPALPPTIIDVEASGFGRGSYPIEIGVVEGGGDCHCTIIRPEPEWQHWDASAEALHGISRDLLLTRGYPVREVAIMLNEWLAGQLVYSDAWGNDSSWIGLLFDCAEIPQRFKLESLRGIMSEPQSEIWHRVKEQVIEEVSFERHRASNDAKILQQTFVRSQHQLESSDSHTGVGAGY